ncbi:surfeit locus 1 family protein [Pandoraea terrae]|uniref:SURF1-like protein n=1 Tax=Pandoraea terrae TaxID=1537710 RepID=A0A5E4SPF6_9BURK|nr:SURF1 family protein [Pandoraea terrae]VVD77567.1 surfeit locus 1 family protein [Pandoraea terrae]
MTDGKTRNTGTQPRAGLSTASLAVWGVVAVVIFAIFVALGTWQVKRRAWKLDLIERVETRVHAPPVLAPAPSQWPQVSAANDEYRHVSALGTFLYDRETYVQAVTELGGGFWVLTPLREEDGNLILINRGFVPPEWRKNPPQVRGPDGETRVTGLLRISEPGGGFLQKNDAPNDNWYSRDVQAIAQKRELAHVAPYFIDADAGPKPEDGKPVFPVGGLTVISFPNSHLVYAFTWYTLALMTAGAIVFIGRQEIRRRRNG